MVWEKGDRYLLHFALLPPSLPLAELVLLGTQGKSEIRPELSMQGCWEQSCSLIVAQLLQTSC